jgi:type II secretory pathway predicted ATPase ExeA
LLWLDEAEQLDAMTFVRLRAIVEAELMHAPLFSVVLAGQPALQQRLFAPELLALSRRLGTRRVLSGLRRDELVPFVEHRFGESGAGRVPLSIHDELFERTRGAPGLLDHVLARVLTRLTGAIDAEAIRIALDEAGL